MDVAAFCQRVGYAGPIARDDATLRALHRAVVTAVPFENLDIHMGRPIVIDEAAFFDKIVLHRRGGFCFELNGLFAAILRELGFEVTLLSARVFDGNGEPGREFGHLALLVTLERRWIADVGFGEWSPEPLCLETRGSQWVDGMSYRITHAAPRYQVELRGETDGSWKPRYSFTLEPRRLSDFAEMCQRAQTAPESPFRRRRMCTRRTPEGRLTLTDEKLIITSGKMRKEIVLDGVEAYDDALAEHFGIVLPRHARWSVCQPERLGGDADVEAHPRPPR